MSAILLDTNVLSELMKTPPNAAVLRWFASQQDAVFFLSAITHAEILLGVACLPEGKRRTQLATAAAEMLNQDFAERSWAFDDACAADYSLIVASLRRKGIAISTEDAQIAAIARVHAAPLASRNFKDFAGIEGLVVINPWDA